VLSKHQNYYVSDTENSNENGVGSVFAGRKGLFSPQTPYFPQKQGFQREKTLAYLKVLCYTAKVTNHALPTEGRFPVGFAL